MQDYEKEIARLQNQDLPGLESVPAAALRPHEQLEQLRVGQPPLSQPLDAARVPDTGGQAHGHGSSAVPAVLPWLVMALLLWFAYASVDKAWDGYYLHPLDAVFVLFPLTMAVALFFLRKSLGRAALDDGNATSTAESRKRYERLVRPLRWALMALLIGGFVLRTQFPQGIPLGAYLGKAAPAAQAASTR